MRQFALHALIFGMAMGFIAQDRVAELNAQASLFEALVFDSLPDLHKAQEI